LLFFFPQVLQAQEQVLVLGPADFLPAREDTDYFQNGYQIFSETGATYRDFVAPIHLPEDSRILKTVVFYVDNHAGNVQVVLYRANLFTEAYNIISQWVSSGISTSRQTAKVYPNWAYNRIKNGGYTYYIGLTFLDSTAGSNISVFGIKIFYN
jgi:hypothetical protein